MDFVIQARAVTIFSIIIFYSTILQNGIIIANINFIRIITGIK